MRFHIIGLTLLALVIKTITKEIKDIIDLSDDQSKIDDPHKIIEELQIQTQASNTNLRFLKEQEKDQALGQSKENPDIT